MRGGVQAAAAMAPACRDASLRGGGEGIRFWSAGRGVREFGGSIGLPAAGGDGGARVSGCPAVGPIEFKIGAGRDGNWNALFLASRIVDLCGS